MIKHKAGAYECCFNKQLSDKHFKRKETVFRYFYVIFLFSRNMYSICIFINQFTVASQIKRNTTTQQYNSLQHNPTFFLFI